MAKKLKLWNGRMADHEHGYVAAYSRADAMRVFEEALGYAPRGLFYELRDYWHEGSWGNAMISITPERGLWAEVKRDRNDNSLTAERQIVRLINGQKIPVKRGPEWDEFQAKEKTEREAAQAQRQQEYQEKCRRANRLADSLDVRRIDFEDVEADGEIVRFSSKGHKYEVREVSK